MEQKKLLKDKNFPKLMEVIRPKRRKLRVHQAENIFLKISISYSNYRQTKTKKKSLKSQKRKNNVPI